MRTKILYRLVSKDGLKSEIKEMDEFLPVIHKEVPVKQFEIKESGFSIFDLRSYRMRRQQDVIFCEYIEED